MRSAISVFCRCLVVVATAGTLAACYQTTGDLASPLSTASIDTQNSARVAAQAGRATRAPSIPEPGPPPEYLTLEKAKGECWMQAETDKKVPKNVDARGKWVEKCAATKMREQATQWANPSASAPGPAASPQAASLPTLPGFPPLPAFPSFPSAPSSGSAGSGDVTQNGL
jgi:hypothetical protein